MQWELPTPLFNLVFQNYSVEMNLKSLFQAHALKNHELSKTFFNSAFDEQMPEEPVIDIKQENEFDENQDDIPNDNQYDYMQYEIEPDPQLLEEDVKISPEELEKMIKENQVIRVMEFSAIVSEISKLIAYSCAG